MSRVIVKLGVYYLEWSTLLDAPRDFGAPLEEFKQSYQKEYGAEAMAELERRLERVERYGTSSLLSRSAAEMIADNLAGPDQATLTAEEIVRAYCLREPIRDGWLVPPRVKLHEPDPPPF